MQQECNVPNRADITLAYIVGFVLGMIAMGLIGIHNETGENGFAIGVATVTLFYVPLIMVRVITSPSKSDE